MRQKPSLTAYDCQKMMAACRAEAEKNGWNVSIAIVDEGGYLLQFERLDGAGLLSAETAIEKARTAALFRGSTKNLEDASTARPGLMKLPYTPLQGGVPIKLGADCIGGIGVSGVPSENDEQIASAGVAALN